MSMDLFEDARERDRKRLRKAGFMAAPGTAKGEMVWRLPGGDRILSEAQAVALLERMEANAPKEPYRGT